MHESRFLCNNGEEIGIVQPDSDCKEAVENDGNGSVEEGAAVELNSIRLCNVDTFLEIIFHHYTYFFASIILFNH